MSEVDLYRSLTIVGNWAADTWLAHGFMAKAYLLVSDSFKARGREDIARLLDNRHLTTPMGHALFLRIPSRYRSITAGILAGGGRSEVRAEIEA
jgi:hypothetical protein